MFNKSHKIIVSKEFLGQRIDNFLMNYLKGIPRSKIYSIIRKGEVRVNGSRKKPLYKISEGDEIRIPPLNIDEKKELFIPENFIKLLKERIVYENQNYLIINKPSGVASHGGSGIKLGLIESVRNFGKLYRDCKLIHRLDKDTSGCQIIAKKQSFLKKCNEEIRLGRSYKEYIAIVNGRWPKTKTKVISSILKTKNKSGEHKVISSSFGKESITNFEVLSLSRNYSKLRCELVTGRTHQIRVHVSQEGYPIVGDSKYGCRAIKNEQKKIKKFYLHSHVLKIPDLGVSFKVEEPEDFDILLKNDENF